MMRRIRKAKRDGTLLPHGFRRVGQLLASIVRGNEEQDVFLWQGFAGPQRPLPCSPGNDEIEITTGRFGDLVDLATERPDAVATRELPGFRQRLKKGDRFYIGRKSGRVLLLAWTSTGNADDILSRKHTPAISPDRPTLLVYDSWTEPGSSDGAACRQFLSVLRLEAASKKRDLLIRCRSDQATFRTELEQQGFLSQYQSIRDSFLIYSDTVRFSTPVELSLTES
ncbi:MAG: hypothetical protein WBE31_21745 [Candidatus Sulfotelmatobacter sp.]